MRGDDTFSFFVNNQINLKNLALTQEKANLSKGWDAKSRIYTVSSLHDRRTA
jgi:hypothetical protein